MGTLRQASLAVALLVGTLTTLHATENSTMLQMATCEESWLDFKQDPVKVEKFFGPYKTEFRSRESDGSFVPVGSARLLGQNVVRVYPQSVGMGLGFSVIVDARFDALKAAMEKQIGRSFEHCGVDEGSRSCEHRIAEKKTIVIMEGPRGRHPQALMGCYYYYEK